MKFINIYGEINNNLLKEIMPIIIDNDELVVYIDSPGGDIDVADLIINELKLKKQVRMYIGIVYSSAFMLAYQLRGLNNINIKVLNGAYGMIHLSSIKISTTPIGPVKENKFYYNNIKDYIKYDFLTDKEKKLYEKGEDIYLSYERLKKIFKS